MSRIYASLPLTGPLGHAGRELLRGAQLALGDSALAELVALDSYGSDREGSAVANAERAAADEDALAYIGDFHSSQVMESAPILGAAGLLAIAPAATYAELRGPTLVRLMPHDGVGARAIADWLHSQGVGELLVVHDQGEQYGVPVGQMCVEAALARGIDVVADAADAQAVVYVGVAGSGSVELWEGLHAADPALWLLGMEGVAEEGFAAALGEGAARRSRFFVAPQASLGFYGYEAMALALDAVAAAGADRAAVASHVRATSDRASVIGRYSFDGDGHTTTTAYGRLAVVGGRLAWD